MSVSMAMGSPRAILHYIGFGVGVAVLIALALLQSQTPVVWFERGVSFDVTRHYIDIEMEGRKPRTCDPLLPLIDEIVRDGRKVLRYRAAIQGSDKRWRETLLEFLEDDTPDSSRLSGWELQSLDTWRWYIPARMVPPPIAVKLEMLHLCGPNRDQPVNTIIGPIRIPKTATLGILRADN